MAALRYAAKFNPFLSLDCAPGPPSWRNPRKGRDQILPSGNTELSQTGMTAIYGTDSSNVRITRSLFTDVGYHAVQFHYKQGPNSIKKWLVKWRDILLEIQV